MSMSNYSNFMIRITTDQIKKVSKRVCDSYMDLLKSFPEDDIETQEFVDLDSLAEVLPDGYEEERQKFREDYPDIMEAYETFVKVFKDETGIDIWLSYISSDAEINGNIEEGANWELAYDQCYVPSNDFLDLENATGACYHEHYVTFG